MKHLRRIRDWEGSSLEFRLKLNADSWFWMVELSVPELFSANKRKIAEIILDAETRPKTSRDFKNFHFVRLPGYFAFYLKGPARNPTYGLFPCALKSHVELYGCEENS